MTACQADSGSCEVTIVDRVHTALRGFRADVAVEGLEAEVVEDEEIGAAEGFDEARMSPVASGEHEVAAMLRPVMIEDGAMSRQALWPMAQASQLLPTPAGPTRARLSWASIHLPCAVQPSGGAIIDVLDACLLPQSCGAQPSGQALVLAP
jgi:hypothetical protein